MKISGQKHHEADGGYSENAIVVNNQLSEHYPNKSLCGAGIVYKFLMVMDDLQNTKGHCRKYLDLCALGNIGDCMSMKEPETRYYITEGLKNVNNECLLAFLEEQKDKIDTLGYMSLAFYIVPLINAIIRMGTMTEKQQLFQAFIEPDLEVETTARKNKGAMVNIVEEVVRCSKLAKGRQARAKDKAAMMLETQLYKFDLLENKILIIQTDEDEVQQELRGLICTQFVNKYNRPCAIVVENEEGFLRGSMRGNASFEGVPDFKAFLEESGYIEYCQG